MTPGFCASRRPWRPHRPDQHAPVVATDGRSLRGQGREIGLRRGPVVCAVVESPVSTRLDRRPGGDVHRTHAGSGSAARGDLCINRPHILCQGGGSSSAGVQWKRWLSPRFVLYEPCPLSDDVRPPCDLVWKNSRVVRGPGVQRRAWHTPEPLCRPMDQGCETTRVFFQTTSHGGGRAAPDASRTELKTLLDLGAARRPAITTCSTPVSGIYAHETPPLAAERAAGWVRRSHAAGSTNPPRQTRCLMVDGKCPHPAVQPVVWRNA